jgi:hypothetical protein
MDRKDSDWLILVTSLCRLHVQVMCAGTRLGVSKICDDDRSSAFTRDNMDGVFCADIGPM